MSRLNSCDPFLKQIVSKQKVASVRLAYKKIVILISLLVNDSFLRFGRRGGGRGGGCDEDTSSDRWLTVEVRILFDTTLTDALSKVLLAILTQLMPF